jgi:hypothetical protein
MMTVISLYGSVCFEGIANMSDNGANENEEQPVAIPIEWHVPETLVSRYATNLTVQRAEHETIISFFELPPPLILGTPADIRAQMQELPSVRAVCVARLIVANGRMPDFVRVLQGVIREDTTEQAEEE